MACQLFVSHVVFADCADCARLEKYSLYSGVNCALGPSKSIRYSRDFDIAGRGSFIAGFVSTYFSVILPGFQMFFFLIWSSLNSGVRYRGVPLYLKLLDSDWLFS